MSALNLLSFLTGIYTTGRQTFEIEAVHHQPQISTCRHQPHFPDDGSTGCDKEKAHPKMVTLHDEDYVAKFDSSMNQYANYNLAQYCTAISKFGKKPHHGISEVYSSVLTHWVLDAFGVGHRTVALGLLHFARENAESLAQSGRLNDDPHLASFMSEAARIERLTLVEGTFTPEDFN